MPSSIVSSRENPRVRRWRKLLDDARARRIEGCAIIEGPRLLAAYLASGATPCALMLSTSARRRKELEDIAARAGIEPILVTDSVFGVISAAESPVGIAAEIALPGAVPDLENSRGCVFLDGIQDAGNVGAILRSAAAFGFRDAVLGAGCADAWSPKVLRAGMGAHFGLALAHSDNLGAELSRFGGTLVCTAPTGGTALEIADLPACPGWLFGAEGRGVSAALAARAALTVSIPIAREIDSLNVAAAAAVCFYEFRRRFSKGAVRS